VTSDGGLILVRELDERTHGVKIRPCRERHYGRYSQSCSCVKPLRASTPGRSRSQAWLSIAHIERGKLVFGPIWKVLQGLGDPRSELSPFLTDFEETRDQLGKFSPKVKNNQKGSDGPSKAPAGERTIQPNSSIRVSTIIAI
jgi:hypothetical protein